MANLCRAKIEATDLRLGLTDHAQLVTDQLVVALAIDARKAKVLAKAKDAHKVARHVVAETSRSFAVETVRHFVVAKAKVEEAFRKADRAAADRAVRPLALIKAKAAQSKKHRISMDAAKNWRHPAKKISAKTVLWMTAKRKCCLVRLLLRFQ